MKNTTGKNFIVNIKQGQVTGQYLFLNYTKRQIVEYILDKNLFGESLDSIYINGIAVSDNGVAFVGSMKDIAE